MTTFATTMHTNMLTCGSLRMTHGIIWIFQNILPKLIFFFFNHLIKEF
jgi:hypothetical protein